MTKLRTHISVSADGYVAGPDQTLDEPLGKGGEGLHEWVVALAAWRERHGKEGGEVNASSAVLDEAEENVGAEIMGRGKFGPGPGPWPDEPWNGWWGDEPPFHKPVFVLTNHEREPLTLSDTTFTFVTDGIEAALELARDAAGDRDVMLGGGADSINQYLAAGLVDELELHVVPVLLGGGSRLFEGVGPLQMEQVRSIEAPGVTHLKYRVG
jgi:dihydrofolate reductase